MFEELKKAQLAYLQAESHLCECMKSLDTLLKECNTMEEVMGLKNKLQDDMGNISFDGPLFVHFAVYASRLEEK